MSVAAPLAEATDFSITRIGDVAGAEVTGIDLRMPLDVATKERLWAAFLEHHVLAFRDQDLSPEQQSAFSLNWGELEGHVIRLADGKQPPLVHLVTNLDADGQPSEQPFTSGNYYWHTDKSYHDVPSLMTLLHARELPPVGGDTEFANTALAYDALPAARKAEIAGLKAVHSWEASRRNANQGPATEAEKADRPPVTHPLVRTHPDSGAKTLYVGHHVSHIEGLPAKQAGALLRALNAHAGRRDFIYAHKWQPGDLVIWDNRTLLHRAVGNYAMGQYRRILHRTVVRGSVPY